MDTLHSEVLMNPVQPAVEVEQIHTDTDSVVFVCLFVFKKSEEVSGHTESKI